MKPVECVHIRSSLQHVADLIDDVAHVGLPQAVRLKLSA